jgi:hypothetical protein
MAGWLATFVSTAVALYLDHAAVGLLTHLNLVNALALLFFFALAVGLYLRRMLAVARKDERAPDGEADPGEGEVTG